MAYPTPISAHRVDFEGAKFVANKPLTLNGKQYQPGDPIPDGVIPPRRARQMFEQRKITVQLPKPDAPAEKAPAKKAAAKKPAAPKKAPAAKKPAAAKKAGGRKKKAPESAETAPSSAEKAPAATEAPDTPAEAPSGAENPVGGYTVENGFKAVHRHFGNWDVIGPDGQKVSGPHKRDQIEHLIV